MIEQALTLGGSRKVAALMIALGTDVAARLMPLLSPESIDQVALDLIRTPHLEAAVRDAILEETYTSLAARGGVLTGGTDFAREIFAAAFGPRAAEDMLGRAVAAERIVPFAFLQGLDAPEAAELLSSEHPQTIAIVLAHLEPGPAAAILMRLEPSLQAEIARRIAMTEQTTPDALSVVEDGIRRRMSSIVSEATQVGGARPLAHVLNQVDRSTERQILAALSERDAELADEVRRFMFVFEDIILLDDRSMQRVIRELDNKDIALALRSTNDEVKAKFFGNISQRAAEMLKDEMSIGGPVRIKNVEEAQGRIVEVIKRLEDQDEIIISRGGEGGDILV